ncbi:hypothetical protein ABXT70_08600 [Candidatus Njordibacter sp. Uisw_039]|uniref:hypothetical protein n=1 Tax=Candidatus Njordibacter sp. Uisw_039 TaxID=3230972 RepID=UPI003D4992DE
MCIHRLANLYISDKEAAKQYTLAAEQGYALDQYALGFMYSSGNAAIRDYKRAYMWYDISASNGVAKGSQHKEIIAKKMTPAQITKAQEMSIKCLRNEYAD